MTDMEELLVRVLFAEDLVLLPESDFMLHKIVDEFDRACRRRKLRVND